MERAVFKYIEHIIREYPDVEKILSEKEQDRGVILSSPINDGTGVRSGISRPTEAKALKLMTSKSIDQMNRNQRSVYVIVSELPEEKYRFIDLYYWQRPRLLSNEGIAQKVNISLPTLYEWRRNIVKAVGVELGLCNP